MKKYLALSIAAISFGLVFYCHPSKANTVLPTSNVLGDSANTPGALVFRDPNGNTAVQALGLGIVSTTTLNALSSSSIPGIGYQILVEENINAVLATNAFNTCVSTSTNGPGSSTTSAWVYIDVTTGTNSAGGGAQNGAACIK